MYQHGRSLLGSMTVWAIFIVVVAIASQILLTEFIRWMTILAPWILLILLVGGGGAIAAAVARRRLYDY